MRQIEDIENGRGLDGEILLSEYYSDNNIKSAKVYHRPFGGYIAKLLKENKLVRTLYVNNEVEAECFAEDWVYE
tara:strand:+ start:748 stop:969 length:222 start_codon:yes stop_codon:yes gene_type:complete